MAAAKKSAKKKSAKKPAAKKAAKKPAAKKAAKKVKKTVNGRAVTAEIKSKGSRKAAKGCSRVDIGGGNVVELCVAPPKRKKASEEMMASLPEPGSAPALQETVMEKRRRKRQARAALGKNRAQRLREMKR
jgi:hypothetical protein